MQGRIVNISDFKQQISKSPEMVLTVQKKKVILCESMFQKMSQFYYFSKTSETV